MGFVQCAFSCLNERNAILGVAGALVQTAYLSAHFFGDGETGGVVTGTVDAQARGEFL